MQDIKMELKTVTRKGLEKRDFQRKLGIKLD